MEFILINYSNLSLSEIQDFSVLFCTFVPITIYSNADTSKLQILSENKGITGVYMWTHIESGKKYVGSAVDISKRMYYYYSIRYLTRYKTSHINNALLVHGYSAFSLTIFEYIDISHLPKEEARKLILEREQLYINSLDPEYNINPIAGSRLSSKASVETLAKISLALRGENHPMFGRTHSVETIAKMSKALKGKTFSEETKKLLREARARQIFSEETPASRPGSPPYGGRLLGVAEGSRLFFKKPRLLFLLKKKGSAPPPGGPDSPASPGGSRLFF